MPKPRLLYLGLDACDSPTVLGWMRDGLLPSLAAIRSRSLAFPTKAPYGTFVGSTWPSFATGRRPEHHDHWNWIQVDLDHTDRYVSPRQQTGDAFWRHLDRAGLRVAVADVPHSLAPASFDGSFVSEWGGHDRLEGTQWTPTDLLTRMGVGPHPVGCRPAPDDSLRFAPCDPHHRSGLVRDATETAALVHDLLVGIERKQTMIEFLIDGGHDVVISVFGESHCVGHQLWHVHDGDHDRHDPAVLASLPDDPLLMVYRRLDAAVGALVDRVGPGTTVLVHLSHGMQAHHDGTHLLDPLLWRIEQIDACATPGRISQALDRVPIELRGPALPIAYRWAGRKPESTAPDTPHERAARRFYQLHNNTVVGAVRVNQQGREQPGVVAVADRPELLDHLEQRLASVINLASGEPVVERCVRGDDIHERRPDDLLPDLYVEWNRRTQIERVWSPELGVVRVPYRHWRTGDHHDDGTLFVAGPDVEPGDDAEPIDLIDVPVSICARFGVDLPDADGVAMAWAEGVDDA